MDERILPVKKNVALVAHDNCKDTLVDWAKEHAAILRNFSLIATGSTGEYIENAIQQKVRSLLSGPVGGDQQLGSMIAEGKIDMIIFFWDPMCQQPHDNDVKALQRLAVLWNVLLACNRTTADFMITSPLQDLPYKVAVPKID